MGMLCCGLVCTERVKVVITCDEAAIGLIKHKDQAAHFFCTQTHSQLSHDLPKILGLHIVLIGKICHSEDSLRSKA